MFDMTTVFSPRGNKVNEALLCCCWDRDHWCIVSKTEVEDTVLDKRHAMLMKIEEKIFR